MRPGSVPLLRIEGDVGWCICRDCSCFYGLFLLSVLVMLCDTFCLNGLVLHNFLCWLFVTV